MKKSASVVFSVLLLGGMMASGVMNGARMASDYNDWVNDTVAVDSIFEDSVALIDYSDEVTDDYDVDPSAGNVIEVSGDGGAYFKCVVNADGRTVTLVEGNANGSSELTIPFLLEDDYFTYYLTGIDGNAFRADAAGKHPLSGVKHLYIANGIAYVGKNAFADAPDLQTVTLPSSLKRISAGMFFNCKQLVAVSIPVDANLGAIEKLAFAGCSSLASFEIPASVSEIEETAWMGCTSLKEFLLHDENSYLHVDHGALYDCHGVLLHYSAAKADKRYEVRFGTLRVGSAAFSGNPYIEEVELPITVDLISDGAFKNCASLRKVQFAGAITAIGRHAFEQCPNLAKITLYGNPDFTEGFDAHTKVVVAHQEPPIVLPQSEQGVLASGLEYVSTSSCLLTEEIANNENYGFPASLGKGRWAVYGNSGPKNGVLKVLEAIPADMLALKADFAGHKVLRVYLDKSDTLHPKLLFFTAGTGGNDLILAYFEDGNLQEIEKEIEKIKQNIGS